MKEFKPNAELIELLESRNVIIEYPNFALKVLDYENYYYLINGYKSMFISSTNPSDTYKPGTTFKEIVALYSFDRVLRELLLPELLRAEHVYKTRLVHVFSKYHGQDHTSYLRPDSFNSKDFVNFKRTNAMIFSMFSLIDKKQREHGAVQHYLKKYGFVPLWVLSKVMTFGKLNSFYSCMIKDEKEEVAASFNLAAEKFRAVIDFIAVLRNKCAHGERIYCHAKDMRIPRPIPDLPEHEALNIPRNQKGYKYGKTDILALIICLKYFMHPNRYNALLREIDFALHKKLQHRLNVIDVRDVKEVMGLNCNWLQLRN